MNHHWWLEYLPFVVLGIAHIIIGVLVVGIVSLNTEEGEKDAEKKCCDKSDGFLAGLLVGWFFF